MLYVALLCINLCTFFHALFITFYFHFVQRNPKKVDNDGRQTKRSVVDVFVRYPTDSVVDIDDVQNKLKNGNNFQGEININITSPKNATNLDPDVIDLRQRNASLFWGLIIICIIVVIIIVIIICCNCFPGCYYYDDTQRRKLKNDMVNDLETNAHSEPVNDPDITVLNVKNEKGEMLKDAKFVEIIKSAKHRIRSAMSRDLNPSQNVDKTQQSPNHIENNRNVNSRLFEASRRPRIWDRNSVRPIEQDREILVLQDANTPYHERRRFEGGVSQN